LHPHAKFFRCSFKKCGLRAPKITKINFWYIFGQKRYIPLSNFYKIWRGEGLPGPHGRANFRHCGFKNVAILPPKSPKIAFLYKFAPKKKSRGSIQKLEYRCTTRNLPLCNGAIIALKITLLHSVSIITNFVIPKRDITKLEINMHHLPKAMQYRQAS